MSELDRIKETYEREGYVVVRNVLDPALIAEVRGHVHWLLKKHPDLKPDELHSTLVRDDPFWLRLVSDDRLLDVAEQFIGPNIALFASHYICKPPKTGRPVLWHQDGSYWPLQPLEVTTMWLAASESNQENGCMRVIPRTQHTDLQEMKERKDVDSTLGSSMDDSFVDESKAVNLELNPGDVSLHHPNIIHGSEANTSDKWRMGLTIRYIPTSTQITDQPWHSSFLLRGHAVSGVNEYLERPEFDQNRHYPWKH